MDSKRSRLRTGVLKSDTFGNCKGACSSFLDDGILTTDVQLIRNRTASVQVRMICSLSNMKVVGLGSVIKSFLMSGICPTTFSCALKLHHLTHSAFGPILLSRWSSSQSRP